MSDTPTTAEEVIAQAIVATVEARRRGRSHLTTECEAGAIVAALRSSPEALADLNGGEWVQPKDAAGKVPVWFQKFRDAWPEKRKPSEIGRTRPLFVFVPKEGHR